MLRIPWWLAAAMACASGVVLGGLPADLRESGGQEGNVQFGRPDIEGFRVLDSPAMGQWEDSFGGDRTRTSSAPPPSIESDLVLNEVVSANVRTLEDDEGDSPDWIELYNGRATPVALDGWGLSDDPRRPFRWTFPAVILPARSYRVVFASGKDRRDPFRPLHTNFQIQADGEPVVLTSPDGRLHDQLVATRLREDLSVARHPNGTGPWRFLAVPTPGRSNTPEIPHGSVVLDPPVVVPASGFHPAPFAVQVSAVEPDVTLHYTLDGSEPTDASPVVAGPIPVRNRTGDPAPLSQIRGTATVNQHTDGWKPPLGPVRQATVLRVRGLRPGGVPGPVVTRTYFVGPEAVRTDGLPTLSLSTDPDGFLDYHRGIYMLGAIFDRHVASHPGEPLTGHTPANYTQRGDAWERPAWLEWFETDGRPVVSEPVWVDIKGQSSRSFRQKSFGVRPRGSGPPRDTIVHPVFPGLTRLGDGTPLESFQSLRLRNMGNDWDYALMRDDWCHRLADGLGLDRMASRFVSLYLNGEYWGILAAREQQDPRYLKSHYGLDPDEVVILRGDGVLEEGLPGDERPWRDLLDYCRSGSPEAPERFAHVAARIDLDDALTYFLSEIYFGNADWPQNNIRVWRRRLQGPDPAQGPGRDGRWRWFLFDLDLGVAHPWSAGVDDDTLGAALSPSGRPGLDAPWGTAVLRALLTRPAWREDFINAAAGLLNSWYSADRAVAMTDQLEEELRPAMEEHIRRWRGNGGSVAAWETRVGTVRRFASLRTTRVRAQLQRHFRLGPTVRITLRVSDPEGGTIRIHRLRLDESIPGGGTARFPWSGLYFRNVPVPLEAIPSPGWRFAGWSGLAGEGPSVQWHPDGPVDVTARFEPMPPRIEGVQWEERACTLVLIGVPDAPYVVQQSGDLAAWSDLATVVCGPDGRLRVPVSTTGDSAPGRFLRVLPQPHTGVRGEP